MNDKISEFLNRNVSEVIDRNHLEKRLRGKTKLRIKLGIDPTSINIHVGRAIALWKLRQLQDMGHKIVLIVGDFTGLIGDTSDKDSERPMLSPKQVKENMKDYIRQFGKIVDLKKAEVHFNSKWLKKLGYLEIAEQADQFSLHEFESRENIARRMKKNQRVSLREVLYPLMQGYDSVAVNADLEIGGTDQRFNLLAGRTMQKYYGQEPQDIMTFDLLEGTDGRKMSSSWGNVINITDEPNDMFGKTMSIKDELIIKYFVACTAVSMDDIKETEKGLNAGKINPRDAKAGLAREIVALYHGVKAADKAEQHFMQVHVNRQNPENIRVFKGAGQTIVNILVKSGIAASNSQARRLIDQDGVKVDGIVCKKYDQVAGKGVVLQAGKRNFIKVF